MARRSLAEWLDWQGSLNAAEIDLTLDRVQQVCSGLNLALPAGRVFTVAGTNGKGTCSAVLERALRHAGYRTGLYTSPHLSRYNERIAVNGKPLSDATIVEAFEQVEAARGDIPLTYFEFGTLAAMVCFSKAECDSWVLEVGLGGRLDAVNVVDPDFAIITTIHLDHQAWLGDTIEAIAAEKAGILRAGRPAFYGDVPVPASVRSAAEEQGANLYCLEQDFAFSQSVSDWSWQGLGLRLSGIELPVPGTAAQLRNASVALAALARFDPGIISGSDLASRLADYVKLPGRFELHCDQHDWVLDVAHNPQAAEALVAGLSKLSPQPTTAIVGMLADKASADFLAVLAPKVERWIFCSMDSPRAMPANELAEQLPRHIPGSAVAGRTVDVAEACALARELTPAGERILVCGSFYSVGPAREWLGLY